MAYTWKGMQKVSYKVAVELWKRNVIGLYLLYDENTESTADSLEAIEEHHSYGGEFGFEKAGEYPEED